MTILTQLFEAPTFDYSVFNEDSGPGTEEFGRATLAAGMNFMKASYLHTLALAQEDAMGTDKTGALIPDAFKMIAEMALNTAGEENPLAAHIAEGTIAAIDHIHDAILKSIDDEGWLLYDDEGMVVLDLQVVTDRLEAASAA